MKETGVIVVVDEETKSVDVSEVGLFSIVPLLNLSHVLAIAEDVVDGVVHRVVKEGSDAALVGSDISRVAIKALSHLEDAGGLTKLRPKVFWNLRNGINSKAIEAIGINHELYPVLQLAANVVV